MERATLVPGELPAALTDLVGPYLARQRWYAGSGPPATWRVVGSGHLGDAGSPMSRLWWAIIEANGSEYQLLVAQRPEADGGVRVRGHEEAFLGNAGGFTYYDATVDAEMALRLLEVASGGSERAQRARPLVAEQSNTSVVYDDRLILKIFRRLSRGPNPDVEVTSALAAAGFPHVAPPLVRWQRDGTDLAFGQQYLAGGTDGWALALTSLHDLYGAAGPGAHPAMSGGDFAAEVERLGQMTGEMHLAMARAFGVCHTYGAAWADLLRSIERQLGRAKPDLVVAAQPLLRRLRSVADPGPAVHAHGDYHLGQVMRTDGGWYVMDFEGEPNRSLEERSSRSSVMKDVAGMLRSLNYASRFALAERADAASDALEPLARAWEDRNRTAFMRGYLACEGTAELMPASLQDRLGVRLAFELDKALYELAYEKVFRPGWAAIPEAAVRRLVLEPAEGLTGSVPEPLEPPGAPETTFRSSDDD